MSLRADFFFKAFKACWLLYPQMGGQVAFLMLYAVIHQFLGLDALFPCHLSSS
jgi:hypothetical protein